MAAQAGEVVAEPIAAPLECREMLLEMPPKFFGY
jgi:hypothetical protein